MEPPNSVDADSLRNEKVKVIQATRLADRNWQDVAYGLNIQQVG
jgi:glucose-6-phosphate 1-dehydrogenase